MARSRSRLVDTLVAEGRLARGVDTEGFQVFCFANHTPLPGGGTSAGECYSEWIVGTAARGLDEEAADALYEAIYDGDRATLERLLRRDGKRRVKDFAPFPRDVAWVAVDAEGALLPALQDPKSGCVLVLLTSAAEPAAQRKGLARPDPDRAREPGEPMQRDVWFERCGDGGVWILGLDEEVLVLYVDAPGDQVYSRWSCPRATWDSLWRSAFGAAVVPPPAPAAAPKKAAPKKKPSPARR